MAVKVTLVGNKVEKFDHEDANYDERRDGKLEVDQGDGNTKLYRENTWVAVEGKKKPFQIPFA
ncbi:hypothetical protein AWB92_19060 [Mycobacterium sp. IEC1808]|uniref:Uncharacterized protein n=1 Tax=Mycobacterium paraense TaxID=767916 RepID=A0A1X2ASV4_9MYCO|nr:MULTISPECIES: hypothetical protein [Mycobacterium]ORW54527.1 hypothetical protein AWB90_00010 [Mycobacterium paraense]ORW91278.1 hypothetical protein AWB92_19060 [Mycobacterium sp. IEC1808]